MDGNGNEQGEFTVALHRQTTNRLFPQTGQLSKLFILSGLFLFWQSARDTSVTVIKMHIPKPVATL